MIIKIISALLFFVALHTKANGQVRQQIEKHLLNPQRAEQEAKADRRLQEKNRIIADSLPAAAPSPVTAKSGLRKKKACLKFL